VSAGGLNRVKGLPALSSAGLSGYKTTRGIAA